MATTSILALGHGLLRSSVTSRRGGAPRRGLRRRGGGTVAAVTCRAPRGQWRRWRVGPRRVRAGKGRWAVNEGVHGGATVAGCRVLGWPANGLAGAAPRGVHPDMAMTGGKAHPSRCQWAQGLLRWPRWVQARVWF